MTEAWLSGPIPGVEPLLQPVAHAFVQAGEDVSRAAAALTPEELWARPGAAASIGFHLMHLAGSLDRLLTYARGATLDEAQRQALAAERAATGPEPGAAELVAAFARGLESALRQVRETPVETLLEPRTVGRAGSPSTVLGLLFHAAEHTTRHAGQMITTAKILRAAPPTPS